MSEVLRAFRFSLDPSPSQRAAFARHAGSARCRNHAAAAKVAAHEEWRHQVAEWVDSGVAEAEARKRVKVKMPTKPTFRRPGTQQRATPARTLAGAARSGTRSTPTPFSPRSSTLTRHGRTGWTPCPADARAAGRAAQVQEEGPRTRQLPAPPRREEADDPARFLPTHTAPSHRRGAAARVGEASRPDGWAWPSGRAVGDCLSCW